MISILLEIQGRISAMFLRRNGEYLQILKIDPGEGLCLNENSKEASSIQNFLWEQEAVSGTHGVKD